MKNIVVIPARMGSSRFPGKPVATALGIPMIIHVAKRCMLSEKIHDVFVATCDQEIVDLCAQHGIRAVMTSDTHERCTDRVAEAIGKLGFPVGDQDFILMVQGDEILVTPKMLEEMVDDFRSNNAPAVNLLSPILNEADYNDPNVVKVVSSYDQRALYLSRAPIPSRYRDAQAPLYQQTGLIGFSKEFLLNFSELPQTPLEKTESIDMLRTLEHGHVLRVVYTDRETIAVDVPADLARAERVLQDDPLIKKYA